MTMRCKVCDHPKLKKINRELVGGRGVTAIARQYGLPIDSVSRHKREHLTRQLKVGAEIALKNTGVEVMTELSDLMTETKSILEEARDRNHNGLALKAIQQLRGNLELISKIQFAIHQSNNISDEELAEFRQWQQMQAEMPSVDEVIGNLTEEERQAVFIIANKQLSSGERVKNSDPVKLRRTKKPQSRIIDESEFVDFDDFSTKAPTGVGPVAPKSLEPDDKF